MRRLPEGKWHLPLRHRLLQGKRAPTSETSQAEEPLHQASAQVLRGPFSSPLTRSSTNASLSKGTHRNTTSEDVPETVLARAPAVTSAAIKVYGHYVLVAIGDLRV